MGGYPWGRPSQALPYLSKVGGSPRDFFKIQNIDRLDNSERRERTRTLLVANDFENLDP